MLGLKDEKSWSEPDLSALLRGKVTILVGCVCLVPGVKGQNVLVL